MSTTFWTESLKAIGSEIIGCRPGIVGVFFIASLGFAVMAAPRPERNKTKTMLYADLSSRCCEDERK